MNRALVQSARGEADSCAQCTGQTCPAASARADRVGGREAALGAPETRLQSVEINREKEGTIDGELDHTAWTGVDRPAADPRTYVTRRRTVQAPRDRGA